jgi:hypothetical protein
MVRYLTVEWMTGALSDEEYEAASAAESSHFRSIRDHLREPLVHLIETHGLHDGQLLTLQVDPQAGTAVMEVDAWDCFNGNYPVVYTLRVEGVRSLALAGTKLSNREGRGMGDIAYLEADIVAEGLYRFDVLFQTGLELGLVFKGITLVASNIQQAG